MRMMSREKAFERVRARRWVINQASFKRGFGKVGDKPGLRSRTIADIWPLGERLWEFYE